MTKNPLAFILSCKMFKYGNVSKTHLNENFVELNGST